MTSLTEMLAEHKAIYQKRQALEGAGEEGESFSKMVSKSDRFMLRIAKTPCADDDEFFAKLAYLVRIELGDYGDPRGRDYEATLGAVRAYLAQRRAAAA